MKTFLFPTLALWSLISGCAAPRTASFATPEDAVRQLVAAAEDPHAADEMLGRGGFSMLRSGDDVADHQDFEAVVALANAGIAFEDLQDGRKIALLGNERWELPIPLVHEAAGWRFDVEAGREEILNRRVGRNELSTLTTLRALVEAQHEYAALESGSEHAFALRVWSSEGKHDGLYWQVVEGEPPSPLGELVADAFEEGYSKDKSVATPYHGYLYHLMTAQGRNAPGGARNYLDAKGRLTGGFAFVAWPATYDNSGVMTFLVNQQGIVFQKDLGQDSARIAERIQEYDPDTSWSPTGD